MNNDGSVSKPSIKPANRLKFLLSLLQRISPKLAFRVAIRIFYSPIRFPTPEREIPFKKGAIISREEVNGKPITVYHFGQGKRAVLLVHGWSGRASQFYKLAPGIQNAGFKVFAFTAPAHGSATDKQTTMFEFADSIAYLAKKYGPFEAIIAHSIGGTATLNALKQGVKVKKVVLLGVPGYLKEVVIDFCNRLGLNSKVAGLIIQHLKNKYNPDYEQFSTTRLAASVSIPGLIIHDLDDKDVHITQARANHQEWKNSELVETKGLGHRLILSDQQVIQKIIDFIS
jgi:pimeloyl-ACP methyl ester carboxylesterase